MLILDTENTELLTKLHRTCSTYEKGKKPTVITAFKPYIATSPKAPHLKRRELHQNTCAPGDPLCSAVLLRSLVPLRSAVPLDALPHPEGLCRPGLLCQPNLPCRPDLLSAQFLVQNVIHHALPSSSSSFQTPLELYQPSSDTSTQTFRHTPHICCHLSA